MQKSRQKNWGIDATIAKGQESFRFEIPLEALDSAQAVYMVLRGNTVIKIELIHTLRNLLKEIEITTPAPAVTPTSKPTNEPSKSTSVPIQSSFTNKSGTPATKCAHAGCNNYIASSGDTNYCVSHSKRCLECGCYIDEDAAWCISCIEKALKQHP